ncbi:MAG TPA: EF-P beta-lysylation protein EpmB [Steroidobacteraceae bacterium]|jgi:EF-P beta-lysylation protein EpmB|nr:EF-P beta-lysylation protein EpmB [Steroidobacteraceae bacterium]
MTATAWQRELAESTTSPEALLAALGLDSKLLAGARAANETFDLRVTPGFLSRMRRGDVNDPLLRQVLPLADELIETPGYGPDPLQEHAAVRAPGLLQKYAGRALLITTQACAIHCRYCFRREFPYSAQQDAAEEGAPRFHAALARVAADSSIEEVILSGGDPLSLSDARLARITAALAAMPHVRRIRVHTRQPVVLPSRVDDGLLAWLRGIKLPTVFVLHVNHANEIDGDVRAACGRLRAVGVTLLNQSVLLKGVNDDADTLAQLSRALMDAGVVPYYLHLPDRVRGTAHFDVAEADAQRLIGELSARLSGYLVPRLVREIPGAAFKVPSVAGA